MGESILTQHEKDLERIRNFRLMDDDFMTSFFNEDPETVQFVLRSIMNKEDLIVKSVKTQYKLHNLRGRSVALDVFATDSNGEMLDIEIQRSDRGAGAKRARYHSCLIDSNALARSAEPLLLPESYVIFITENDVLQKELPIYHVERVITELNVLFNDGEHILYVNGQNNNLETELGKLLHDFRQSDPGKMFYPLLAQKARFFKETEEGIEIMCRAMEEMRTEAAHAAVLEYKKESIARKLKRNFTPEQIHETDELPMELILEVQKELLQLIQ